MNEDIIRQKAQQLKDAGAPEEQISTYVKAAISEMQNKAPSQPTADTSGDYFGKSVVEGLASPFLKIGASGAALVAGASNLAGRALGNENMIKNSEQDLNTLATTGVQTPLGTAKPIGAIFGQENDMSTPEKIARMSADILGTTAEIGSYAFAPIKAAGNPGFWETALKTVKNSWKPILGLGGGIGLQAAGEGKSMGESATQAAGATLGAAAGMGLMSGTGALLSRYGGRLLQSDAVAKIGNNFKNFADKVYDVLPEAFKGDLAEIVPNLTTKEGLVTRFNTLNDEFKPLFKQMTDSMIEQVSPQINSQSAKDLTMNAAQLALQKEKGKLFDAKSAMYDSIKNVPVSGFEKITEPITKLANEASQLKPMDKASGRFGEALAFAKDTLNMIKNSKGQLSMDQILQSWEKAKSAAHGASNEDSKIILDIGQKMFDSARESLAKTNPDALSTWNQAYQNWLKAVNLNESPVLNLFKDSGDIDTFVQKAINQQLTIPEKKTFMDAIANQPELKGSFSNMLMKSVLDVAKSKADPKDGASVLNNFIKNWNLSSGDTSLFSSGQTDALLNTARMLGDDLTNLISGMRQTIGIGEKGANLQDLGSKLDVLKSAKEGNYDSIYKYFYDKLSSNEFSKVVDTLGPEEQKVIGFSAVKDLIDENTPLFKTNTDGTVNFSTYAKAFENTYKKINDLGSDGEKLFTPEQIKVFEKTKQELDNFENISHVPTSKIKNLLKTTVALIQTYTGQTAAALRTTSTIAPSMDKKAFYDAIDNLVKTGDLAPNIQMTIGDVFKNISGAAGQISGRVGSDATGANE